MTKKGISSILLFNSRFTSIVSIALVLFLLGLIMLAGLLGNKLSTYVKENVTFTVMLKENQSEASIEGTKQKLEAYPFIKSIKYISKEQALKELTNELGEDPSSFLGFNPLQASFEINLTASYANPDSLPQIEKAINSYASVSELSYRQDMIQMVENNLYYFMKILLILAGILVVVSFLLINNTIRLYIYSKRFLIYTMRLVGATPGFIRRPIVLSNIGSGILASLLAIMMLSGTLYYFQQELGSMTEIITLNLLLVVFGLVMLSGIILSSMAACWAVNHFLRMKVDKMYYH